jgi:hypothetical protein
MRAVLDAPLQGLTAIEARAGTGKTTLLELLAQRHHTRSGLYLSFDKASQMEASRRFPRSVACKTINGLAFEAVGKAYGHKIKDLKPRAVAILLGLGNSFDLARAVIQILDQWMNSSDLVFPERPPFTVEATLSPARAAYAVHLAEQAWGQMMDPASPFPMPHAGYLKAFQLSRPRIAADYIMLDEFQDTNPVTWDIVRSQVVPSIIVGDRYQSIYEFRGAVNAFDDVPADRRFVLTHSFRFGPLVAEVASSLLWGFFADEVPVIAKGFATQLCDQALLPAPQSILARTNMEIFNRSCEAAQAGMRLAFGGKVEGYGHETLLDMYRLGQYMHDEIRDPFLRSFDSFEDLTDYAERVRDLELMWKLKAVTAYGSELPRLIGLIRQQIVRRGQPADVFLCTLHRSKGMTLDNVYLADDGPALIGENGLPLPPEDLDPQEIHLAYVGVTRAKKSLRLSTNLVDYLRALSCHSVLNAIRRSESPGDPGVDVPSATPPCRPVPALVPQVVAPPPAKTGVQPFQIAQPSLF